MRVLVFGDSITQGFWDTEGGWAARLRKYYDELQVKDLRHNDEPVIFNLGISAGTSKTILARFDAETSARKNSEPMALIFSTGLNDSYREGADKYNSTPEQYAQNLKELIEKAKKYSDKILFVGLVAGDDSQTMPVFWRDIYYTNERTKQFEEIMRKTAEDNGAAFVPIFDDFKKATDNGRELLADGLHPNNGGHELIFQLVRPALDELLG